MTDKVLIPNDAIGAAGDLTKPTQDLLQGLSLLPDAGELEDAGKVSAVISGPPQSVAVIEAGLTAASKWWAAGFGATAIVAWGKLYSWWESQKDVGLQNTALQAVALITVAALLAVAYVIASDVRGRSRAAVATIEARARVADRMISAAQSAYGPPSVAQPTIIPLPGGLAVKNLSVAGDQEDGWTAIAISIGADGAREYVVVRNQDEDTLPASKLNFGVARSEPPAAPAVREHKKPAG